MLREYNLYFYQMIITHYIFVIDSYNLISKSNIRGLYNPLYVCLFQFFHLNFRLSCLCTMFESFMFSKYKYTNPFISKKSSKLVIYFTYIQVFKTSLSLSLYIYIYISKIRKKKNRNQINGDKPTRT